MGPRKVRFVMAELRWCRDHEVVEIRIISARRRRRRREGGFPGMGRVSGGHSLECTGNRRLDQDLAVIPNPSSIPGAAE